MLKQKSEKILIVDDEPEIAQALKMYLDGEGYDSSVAFDGSAALEMLTREKDYALVMLDVSMPGLDGVTVLKHLQDNGSDTAVIMMSGHGSEELAVECMRNGAEDYIAKPFAVEDMLQRIERARSHRIALIEKRKLQQEREDFILMLSHDLKNPLTAVIGSIDIVREGCLGAINEEQKEYLHSAIDSCNEVVTMIDNLLDIRKFEAGKVNMSISSYNVQELIGKIVSQFARPAKYDNIDLVLEITPAVSNISVDKNAFTRVLGNLLGNALKFTPEGGKISVTCSCMSLNDINLLKIPDYALIPSDFFENSKFIRLSVRDTGNGIAPGEINRIFDRYTQFERKSGRERGGAGLGLAYCRLAVSCFNGVIWAESEAESGSEFIILLPCADGCTGN